MTPTTEPPPLFDYQQYANDVLIPEALKRGSRRPGIVAPCGSGKTTQIAGLCRRAASKGNTVTVIAPRRKLIQQLSERLKLYGVRYSVEMADLPDEPWAVRDHRAEIIVGSMQTLASRLETSGVRQSRISIPDECHTINTPVYRSVLKAIGAEYQLGFTATLCQPDGSGFGPNVFDDMVVVTTIEKLIARDPSRLVRTDVYAPVGMGKKRAKGLKTGISGDPVAQWIKHAHGLRTVTFCRTLDECRTVKLMFQTSGIDAEHIDANTPPEVRDEVMRKLAAREILVLVCTPSLMGVGVDIPFLECVQLLTKNDSAVAQWQTVGRVQRVAEGKARGVLLDHAAAVFKHGDPNQSPVWTLDDQDSVQRKTQERMDNQPGEYKPNVCQACGCVSVGARQCPKCSAQLVRDKQKDIVTERESLQSVGDIKSHDGPNPKWQSDWKSMLYQCAAKGLTCAVASMRFKSKYGVYPEAAKVYPAPSFDDRHKKVTEAFPSFDRKRS